MTKPVQITFRNMRASGTVKLTKNQLTDPKDIGLLPVVNTLRWASDRAVNLNLTIPSYRLTRLRWSQRAGPAR